MDYENCVDRCRGAAGFGKRGGARIIYYRYVEGERLYLIYAYANAMQEDLTSEQVAVLAELMKEIDHR
jgi:hypothetical protein